VEFGTRRRLRWLAVVAAGVVIVPALAFGDGEPTIASFTATDISTTNHQWYVSGSSTSTSATISAGGTALFTYQTGSPATTAHNVVFTSALKPTSCELSQGTSAAPPPPMPSEATIAPWSGSCRFDTPGTYTFRCARHPAMTGTVNVVAATASPSATATAVPSPEASATAMPVPAAALAPVVNPSPTPASAATSALVASRQRGPIVRGLLEAVGPDSWFYVHVVADRATLGSHGKGATTVGRLVKFSPAGGNVPFSVRVAPAAVRALREKGRLALTVRVLVLPRAGSRFTDSRAVTLRQR
jgi:plastocyanin